jgi:peptidoglycan hydrolase-like protein with peptidoglycan-binding domain
MGRTALMGCCTLLWAGLWLTTPASAQVIERGVEGGAVGAIIGGIVGGGRGAGTGAAIGAGVGVLSGAAEAEANARDRAYYGPPPGPGYGPGPGNLVFSVQSSLNHLGYDVGPPDGVMGPRTAEAISQYQYANRLPVDGQPSPQLLNYMIRQGG